VAVSEHLHEFYAMCVSCGRLGQPIAPEAGDVQCELCLPLRVRVNRRDAAYILERAMRVAGRS